MAPPSSGVNDNSQSQPLNPNDGTLMVARPPLSYYSLPLDLITMTNPNPHGRHYDRVLMFLQGLMRTPRGSRIPPLNATARQLALFRQGEVAASAVLGRHGVGGGGGAGGGSVGDIDLMDQPFDFSFGGVASEAPPSNPGGGGGGGGGGGAATNGGEAPSNGAAGMLAPPAVSGQQMMQRHMREEVRRRVASASNEMTPLWNALSSFIAAIEESMAAPSPHSAGGGVGAAAAAGGGGGGAAAGGAAAAMASLANGPSNKALPPGAAQLLPLVESFFIASALQGSIPLPPLPSVASTNARASHAGPSSSGSALMPPPSPSCSAMSTGSRGERGGTLLLKAGSIALDEKHGSFVR